MHAILSIPAPLVLILFWIVSTYKSYVRLRHIKGPWLAGLSQFWLVRVATGGRMHLDLHETCQKYGSIARVGPNDLVTNDPALMKHYQQVRTAYRRSEWYNAMRIDPTRDNVLSQRNDEKHAKTRSQMSAGYSGKEVDNLESKIDGNVLRLVKLLDENYVSLRKPFDFGRKAQYFTLDVISDLAFGAPFGDLETDSDVYSYIEILEETMPSIILTTVLPWLNTLLQSPLFRGLLPSDKDEKGIGRTMAVANKAAAERYGPNAKIARDMLGSFVAKGLTQPEAESEILMQILAGADTTATAVRAILLHIISNPPVVDKLRSEIRASQPSWPVITDYEARSMPYLQAVIKEGLRIHPPVTGMMSKLVPPGGDEWKGVHLPGGTKIGWSAFGMARRPEIWGEDAREFRPERWLECGRPNFGRWRALWS